MDLSKFRVPLLMVNGHFRSLNTLTIEELESFISFMTSCTLKEAKGTETKGAPNWWARSIDFKFPLRKPKGLSDLGYKRHLQAIICKCYCFYDAHFLLTFSSQFAEYPQSIFLKSNANNTTSVFSIENVAEIFTFGNENKEYDSQTWDKPYWSTLPSQTSKPDPKVVGDIYLCENCDIEFYNQVDMESHEKECCEPPVEELPGEVEIIKDVRPPLIEPGEKDFFMDYFGLSSSVPLQQKMHFPPKPSVLDTTENRWVILDMSLHKNRKIEFSSVIGRKMLKHRVRRDVLTRAEKAIIAAQEVCDYSLGIVSDTTAPKPRITYRAPKKKTWAHTYCFTRKQKEDRLKTLRTGLNKRSRKLLENCKQLKVKLQEILVPLDSNFFIVCFQEKVVIPYRLRTCIEYVIELF